MNIIFTCYVILTMTSFASSAKEGFSRQRVVVSKNRLSEGAEGVADRMAAFFEKIETGLKQVAEFDAVVSSQYDSSLFPPILQAIATGLRPATIQLTLVNGSNLSYMAAGECSGSISSLSENECQDLNLPHPCYCGGERCASYNPLSDPWMGAPLAQASWSQVYEIALCNQPGITLSQKIFGDDQVFVVGSVHVTLEQIQSRLTELSTRFRLALLIDSNGTSVVATKSDDPSLSVAVAALRTIYLQGVPSGTTLNQFRGTLAEPAFRSSGFFLGHLVESIMLNQSGVTHEDDTLAALGWRLALISLSHVHQPDHIEPLSAGFFVVLSLGGGGTALSLWLIWFTHKHRNLRIWRVSQMDLVRFILLGNLLGNAYTLSQLGSNDPSWCPVRQWLGAFSLTVFIMGLLGKVERVYRLTKAAQHFQNITVSVGSVFARAAVPMLIVIALLCTFVIYDPYTTKSLLVETSEGIAEIRICRNSNPWLQVALFAFIASLYIIGSFLSYMTRKHSEALAESRALMITFYHSTFIGVMFYTLGLLSLREDAMLLVTAVLMFWFTLASQFVLFGPRVIRQLTGGDLTQAEMTQVNDPSSNKMNVFGPKIETEMSIAFSRSNITIAFIQDPSAMANEPKRPRAASLCSTLGGAPQYMSVSFKSTTNK